MIDLNKLKELKALAGKATPGPWAAASDWERAAVYSTSKDAYPKGKRVVCSGNQNNKGRYNAESWSGSDWSDAAFIAAANPAAVTALIDRLEAAEAELARRDSAAGEPVAVVGSDFSLFWAGSGPIAPLIERHNIKVGDKLFSAAQPSSCITEIDRGGMFDRLREQDVEIMDALDLQVWAYNLAVSDSRSPSCARKAIDFPESISRRKFQDALNALNDCLIDCGDSEQGLRLALTAAGVAEKSIKLPEPYEGDHGLAWLAYNGTIKALREQGFTVEGE